MNCPVDQEVLQISERQGVEIDYCPRCRGVWLDRGELDKILDRVDGDDDDRRDDRSRDRDDRDRYRGDRDDRPHRKKKKKSSFLSEIFEMGG
jgi:Zn-finger nucleic acid-binding protein